MRGRCSRRFLVLVRWLVRDSAVDLIAMVEVFFARHVWLATDRCYLLDVGWRGRHCSAIRMISTACREFPNASRSAGRSGSKMFQGQSSGVLVGRQSRALVPRRQSSRLRNISRLVFRVGGCSANTPSLEQRECRLGLRDTTYLMG